MMPHRNRHHADHDTHQAAADDTDPLPPHLVDPSGNDIAAYMQHWVNPHAHDFCLAHQFSHGE